MFTHLRTLAMGLALVALMACQPKEKTAPTSPALERAAIQQAAALWINGYNARSAGAIGSVFTDDAWIIPPAAPAVIGQRAINEFMSRVWTRTPMQMSIGETDLEITSPTDAWRAGRFEARNESGALVMKGSFIEIWDKIDGKWRMRRSIFNSEDMASAVTSASAVDATPPAP